MIAAGSRAHPGCAWSIFRVGTRLDLADRSATDWPGQLIEVKHQGRTDGGAPRFPVFLRRRPDLFQEPLPCPS